MADYTIGVLQKAMRVLGVIARAQRPVTVTEIHRTTGLPRNTVFRILRTLKSGGWVGETRRRWFLEAGLLRLLGDYFSTRLERWEKVIQWSQSRRVWNGKSHGDRPEGDPEEEGPAGAVA